MNQRNDHSGHWIPQPPDLSEIRLSPELECLMEQLAKNIHDIWAHARISEGWSYGPFRDDALKQTPCLVPYEVLPEEERAYDRLVVSQTLRMILQMGYAITPLSPDSDPQPD